MDWKSLGIELDISSARLNEIDVNNRGMVGACRGAMVEVWLATDVEASWSKLADALVAVGQNVRAELVRELGRQVSELYLGGCGSGKVWLCLIITHCKLQFEFRPICSTFLVHLVFNLK